MSINEKLCDIQAKLKVPKSRTNSFGGYKYRSLEDILDAVKKPLKEAGLMLYMSDRMVCIGNHNYIEASATLTDSESGEKITTTGYARESEVKKGMDDSQITGTTSSYARKYCLNALFLIDDTKDADTDEYTKENKKRKEKAADDELNEADMADLESSYATEAEKANFTAACNALGLKPSSMLKKAGWEEGTKATKAHLGAAMRIVNNIRTEREKVEGN